MSHDRDPGLVNDPAARAGQDRELLRQQTLLRVLWRLQSPAALAGWVRQGTGFTRGLQAYQAHASALAARALAAAYPTVQLLLGAASFAALARALWRRAPPACGDLNRWGAELPDFMAATPDLAAEAYLPDLARLEWAVHRATAAADTTPAPCTLVRLAALQADALCGMRLLPQAGTALVDSVHPVVSIWRAHRPLPPADVAPPSPEPLAGAVVADAPSRLAALALDVGRADDDAFAAARAALAQQRAEPALVWRSGWRVQVVAVDAAEARFTRRILQGQALGAALEEAAGGGRHRPSFDFHAWLLLQLQRGWLAGAAPASGT